MKKILKRTTLILTAFLLLILPTISITRASADNAYPEIYFSDEYTAEPYNDGDYCLKYTFRFYVPSFVSGTMTENSLILQAKTSVSTGASVVWISNSGVIDNAQQLQLYGDVIRFDNNVQYKDRHNIPYETSYVLTYDESKDMYYMDIPVAVHRSCTDLYISAQFSSTNHGYRSTTRSTTVYWMDEVYDYIDDVYRTEMEEQIATLQAEKAELQAVIDNKIAEINTLNSRIEELIKEIADLEQEILDLKATHSDELDAKQVEYDLLMAQKLQLDADLAEEKEKLKTANDEVARVEGLLDDTQTECLSMIREREKTIRDLEKEKSSLEKENAELRKQLEKTQASGCMASMGSRLPVALMVLLSGFVIIGRIIYARKKEKI